VSGVTCRVRDLCKFRGSTRAGFRCLGRLHWSLLSDYDGLPARSNPLARCVTWQQALTRRRDSSRSLWLGDATPPAAFGCVARAAARTSSQVREANQAGPPGCWPSPLLSTTRRNALTTADAHSSQCHRLMKPSHTSIITPPSRRSADHRNRDGFPNVKQLKCPSSSTHKHARKCIAPAKTSSMGLRASPLSPQGAPLLIRGDPVLLADRAVPRHMLMRDGTEDSSFGTMASATGNELDAQPSNRSPCTSIRWDTSDPAWPVEKHAETPTHLW
jgi:hypothetical protein